MKPANQQTQAFTAPASTAVAHDAALPIKLSIAILLSMLAGYIALSYEILWIRIFSFASAGRAEIFATVLGYYLLGLAAGALFCRIFCANDKVNKYRSLSVLYSTILISSVLCFLLIPGIAWRMQYTAYECCLSWVGIISIFFGFNLPLLAHNAIEANHRTGSHLSKIYFGNIVGATAGSLLTGFVLLDRWDLVTINTFLCLLGILFAGICLYLAKPGLKKLIKQGVLLITVAILVYLSAPFLYQHIYENLQHKHPFKAEDRFVNLIENKSGVITVERSGRIYGGGAYDGCYKIDLSHDQNGIIRAFFINAIHPYPHNVLMIGLSSGSWAQVIANSPHVKSLTIVEINPGYLALISQHAPVASLLHNPKVQIIIDDGRRWLRRHPDKKFDMIVMNTTFNWREYSSNLLSKDFLQNIHHSLNEKGIIYYNTTSSAEAMHTAQVSFPYVIRFFNFIAASDSPILIDKLRFINTLKQYKIDNKKVIDVNDEHGKIYLERILFFGTRLKASICSFVLDSNESLSTLTKNTKIITDDNMGNEWR